jgi:hypothetical protein
MVLVLKSHNGRAGLVECWLTALHLNDQMHPIYHAIDHTYKTRHRITSQLLERHDSYTTSNQLSCSVHVRSVAPIQASGTPENS